MISMFDMLGILIFLLLIVVHLWSRKKFFDSLNERHRGHEEELEKIKLLLKGDDKK